MLRTRNRRELQTLLEEPQARNKAWPDYRSQVIPETSVVRASYSHKQRWGKEEVPALNPHARVSALHVVRLMGRKKVSIEYIKNTKKRRVTFQGRKAGLVKKAMELSILCDAEIVLLIRNKDGDITQYSSSDPKQSKELLQAFDEQKGSTNKTVNFRNCTAI